MNKSKPISVDFFATKRIAFVLFVFCLTVFINCKNSSSKSTDNDLFTGFQSPPAEARPFVRWWWNGNKIKAKELDRELELLKKAGFGGVEINPIAMPNDAPDNGDKDHVWMSDEWIDLLVHACKKTKDLGMVADLIVGTGWPFGGEFLQTNETCQRVATTYLPYKGGDIIEVNESYLLNMSAKQTEDNSLHGGLSKKTTHKLFHIKLVPENCSGTDQVVDLIKYMDENGNLSYKIESPGNYNLCYGFLQQNFRDVTLGAPGGAGSVMDHYKKEVTYAYLSRLKKISEKTGIPLSELIRALFCDSIEVSGANWTDGFAQLFFETYGYKLDDWISFVFYAPKNGYSKEYYDQQFAPEFKDQLKKVRYDYNKLLVETFLKNFTQVFQDFCAENKLMSRYQAYGTPFLMGMLDGYMIPDIPESNNWIYSAEMKDSLWEWNQAHGYMIWNMYASSGAHLTGKNITSGETMTNLQGVFRTTLEEIKQHDDMNFITGINHSVLHGFNYSPPDVEFPGWIRFGAYFSEYNPWWEHLSNWVDYNARLSYVFQNSQPDKSIAIIGPTSDLWGDNGLTRGPFHTQPEYLYKLWEPISQLGYSSEYINQKVLGGAQIEDGTIGYGNMHYDLLILASLKSMNPETALVIKQYVESGGKIVVIDQLPTQSLHFNDYQENDLVVKSIMEKLVSSFPESFVQLDRPESLDELFKWTQKMLALTNLQPDVDINKPNKNIYQIHQYTQEKEIYFFTNINRYESTSFESVFPVNGKYPWIWNPETGEKTPFYYDSDSTELTISLKPLQSLLLVFEEEKPVIDANKAKKVVKSTLPIYGNWSVEGKRVDGQNYTWEMDRLTDLSKSTDESQRTFGGKIIYRMTISGKGDFTHMDLGNVNEGVTELYINGQKAGTRWYGEAVYSILDLLKEGPNEIEIHYTTVLANYCRSLENNPVALYWTRHNITAPTGIEGPVRLLQYE